MDEKNLLAELTKNCNGKKEKVLELLKAFDLAELGYDVQDQQCKDVYNRVLSENVFLCAREFSRDTGYKIGDRITDEAFDFLLSDEDFQRLQQMALPYMVEEKITDENFYYLTDWATICMETRNNLVNYLIDEIVPKPLREVFESQRSSIVFQDKLINAFKSCLKPAA